MYALIKSDIVENLIEWDGAGNYVPPEGFTAVEATAGTQIGATYVNGVFTNPVPPSLTAAQLWAAYQAKAQAQLNANDAVAMRCIKAGVPYPAAWLACDKALRAIVAATSGDPTQSPPSPPKDSNGDIAYPSAI